MVALAALAVLLVMIAFDLALHIGHLFKGRPLAMPWSGNWNVYTAWWIAYWAVAFAVAAFGIGAQL